MLAYRGSRAHGTFTKETDDIDLIGVCFAPPEHYVGLKNFGSNGTIEFAVDVDGITWDIVVYELRKFMRLLLKSNPNVLSTLFLSADHFFIKSSPWDVIVNSRDVFLSKQAYRAFVGYAYGQLKRMERGIHSRTMCAARRELIERCGYDPKNASHLIRLLRMGIEFLETGTMQIKRPDAEELIAIKLGKWSREQVLAESERLFDKANEAYKCSTLPDEPDRDIAEGLTMGLVLDYLWRKMGVKDDR